MSFRIGIDSYSYHRLLGGTRVGESEPVDALPNGGVAVLEEMCRSGAEYASLETMFMDSPAETTAAELVAAADGMEVGFSWGGSEGFAFGSSPRAMDELSVWLRVAAQMEVQLVRVVVGGPRLRRGRLDDARLRRTASVLATAVDVADEVAIELALENHGDLDSSEIVRLLELTGRQSLGVCFDTANALRVGDDAMEALERLLPWLRMVHLKDCCAYFEDPVAGPVSVSYGEGVVPVAAIVERLDSSGFEGPICVELGQLAPDADERQLVRDGVAWLREQRRRVRPEELRSGEPQGPGSSRPPSSSRTVGSHRGPDAALGP